MWGWSWKWEENFWGPGLLVAWDYERLGFPYTYPSIPTQNSLNLCTFLWILTPLLNTFLVLPNTLFSMMCKMWLKTQLLRSLALLWFPENGWARLLSFPLCLSTCWRLLCSVQCLEQSWLMNFSQGHPFCPPVSTEHSSIGWWQELSWVLGNLPSSLGPAACCLHDSGDIPNFLKVSAFSAVKSG